MTYEYGKQLGHPATSIGMEKILIDVQDGNGKNNSFDGKMSDSWVYFNETDREAIKNILIGGKTIKFRITIEVLGLRSNYQFDIKNVDGFNNAYQQIISE